MIEAEGNDNDYNRADWPLVRSHDWCGEFELPDEEPAGGWKRHGVRHPSEPE